MGFEKKVYNILKSNKKLQNWLLTNKYTGLDYEEFDIEGSSKNLLSIISNVLVNEDIVEVCDSEKFYGGPNETEIIDIMKYIERRQFKPISEPTFVDMGIEINYDYFWYDADEPIISSEIEYIYTERIQKKKKVEITSNETENEEEETTFHAEIIMSDDGEGKIDWSKVKKVENFSATKIDIARVVQTILEILTLDKTGELGLAIIAIDIAIHIYNAAEKNEKEKLTNKQAQYLKIYLENTDFGKDKSGLSFERYFNLAKEQFLCTNQADCIQDLTELINKSILTDKLNTLFLCDTIVFQNGKRRV